MDISSASRSLVSVARLAERLAGRERTHVLTLKTDDFARTSWLHGREQAAELEIVAARRFEEIGRALLRDDDLLVHSFGSDVFAVALCGKRMESAGHDVRRVLASIERAFVERLPITVVSSWAVVRPGDDVVPLLESTAERARRRRDRREFAGLVHDLTTPVSAISGSLAAVLDGGLSPETEKRFLQGAFDEAGRITRMLREFLSAERAEAEEAAPEPPDLADVLVRAFDAVQALAFERDIKLRVCTNTDGPVLTAMDADVAVSLVVNLAANAIKHGHAGGRVQGRIRVTKQWSEIEIDDDGPGIDDADRERIFDFGGRAGTRLAPGWGIGLAQVRRIVREHGGEICAQRSPLGGARFVVRLPRVLETPNVSAS